MQIQFTNVGPSNRCWTAQVQELSHEALYKEVKANSGLMSSGIEFSYDEETNKGEVIVGLFRVVGQFNVIQTTH